MSDALELFDRTVESIMSKVEIPDDWDIDFPNPYNRICPDCGASIPQVSLTTHITWHRSQYEQMRALVVFFDKLDQTFNAL